VPITAKVVSSNPADDEVYFIQHYGIKFATGWWFDNKIVQKYGGVTLLDGIPTPQTMTKVD
jgi:hypothetical protein